MKLLEKRLKAIQTQIENASVAQDSWSGRLLYFYTQYERLHDDRYKKNTEDALRSIIHEIMTTPATNRILRESLLINHLYQDRTIIKALSTPLATLDQYLIERATDGIKAGTLTDWYATAVVSCYFIKRKDQTLVQAYLPQLTSLWNEVESEATGTFNRRITYHGETPLGPEGIAGLLLMLITIERSAIGAHVKALIREGIRYVLSFRREVDFSQGNYNAFPSAITPHGDPIENTDYLGWSTGDLPQTLLLYQASILFQDQELQRISHLIGLNTLLRKDAFHTAVPGGELHSGSAGIAQVYRSLYRLSGKPPYHEGYKRWLRHTLNLADTQLYDTAYAHQEYSLMHGLVGIYLTLLAHKDEEYTGWREVLLL